MFLQPFLYEDHASYGKVSKGATVCGLLCSDWKIVWLGKKQHVADETGCSSSIALAALDIINLILSYVYLTYIYMIW